MPSALQLLVTSALTAMHIFEIIVMLLDTEDTAGSDLVALVDELLAPLSCLRVTLTSSKLKQSLRL